MNNNKTMDKTLALQARPADDLLIIELDDRLEMALGVLANDTNIACNNQNCTQNGYCPKQTA